MKKNSTFKRFLAFLLCAAMMITYMPSSVYTLANENADGEVTTSATKGEKKEEGDSTSVNESSDNEDKERTQAGEDTTAVNPGSESTPSVDNNGATVDVHKDQNQKEQNVETNETRAGPSGETGDQQLNANLKGPDEAADGETTEEDDNTYTVEFRNRDGEKLISSRTISKGESLETLEDISKVEREDYTAAWAIGTFEPDGQSGKWTTSKNKVIEDGYTPTEGDVDSEKHVIGIIPYYEKIKYTVSFYGSEEDATSGANPIATDTVDVDTNYCANNIPQVPTKNGYSGKWVYSGGDFNNSIHVNEVATTNNLIVWPEYEKTVYTVTYKYKLADEEESIYQTDKYYKGDTLELPTAPVEEGHQFLGWYIGETQYTGGEEVVGDMELQGRFSDMYSVKFVVLNDDGETVKTTLTQYFRTDGDTIGTMPQNPFVEGKKFVKWVKEGTDNEVTENTPVDETFRAIAVFDTVDKYKITVNYWYQTDNHENHIFDTVITEVATSDLEQEEPYTITPPASTQTDSSLVHEGPVYYTSVTSVPVDKDDFDDNKELVINIEYVEYTAIYDFVYLLKNLTGNGYRNRAQRGKGCTW